MPCLRDACRQGRAECPDMKFCAMRRFYAEDFNADAEDFGCDSTLTRVAQAIVGAAVLLCAGLAIVAALSA